MTQIVEEKQFFWDYGAETIKFYGRKNTKIGLDILNQNKENTSVVWQSQGQGISFFAFLGERRDDIVFDPVYIFMPLINMKMSGQDIFNIAAIFEHFFQIFQFRVNFLKIKSVKYGHVHSYGYFSIGF